MTPAEFRTLLHDTGAGGGLVARLRGHLATWAQDAEAAGKDNATTFLRRRTGRLAASIRGTVDPGELSARVTAGAQGSEVKYVRVQEGMPGHPAGYTITPRRGKFLAIPTGPALTGAGVSRFASPRDVPGLVFRPTSRGGLLGKPSGKGKNRQIVPWFWLVRSVTIRPRRYLASAFVAAEVDLRDRLASDRLLLLGGG